MSVFMKVLFLTCQIPNPYSGGSIRPFYLIKNLSQKHGYDIYIVSFVTDSEEDYIDKIKDYCKKVVLFPLKQENNARTIIRTLRNALSLTDVIFKLTSKNGVFDPSYYSRGYIQKMIDKFIEQHKLDAIYSDAAMAGYVANSSLPKIVEPLDINFKNWLWYSFQKRRVLSKLYWFIRFLQTFYRETRIYKKFDYCVVVTEKDKRNIERYLSNVVVIPNGVDIHYFKPMSTVSDYPSIVTAGMMSGQKNVEAVLYFYNEIYPKIKGSFPEIKFYIVGKDPHPKILELSKKDRSVIVTGFVEDIRPYIARATVFICSHISGSGIKNQVLEAMAMGKPVVSTSIGALGIDAIPGEEIIIADEPLEFAKEVICLLENPELRKKLGQKARKLVEAKYSWEGVAAELDKLFKKLINKRVMKIKG